MKRTECFQGLRLMKFEEVYGRARAGSVHEYPDGGLALFHGPRRLAVYSAGGTLIGSTDRQAA